MARYPGSDEERRFPEAALRATVAGVFRACGMAEADAALLADSLVQADLRGIHSHGGHARARLRGEADRGGVDPRGRPRVVRDRGSALVVDGGNAMGQIAGAFAMRRAIERARETGVAFAAVGGSNHRGAMEYYVRMTVAEE